MALTLILVEAALQLVPEQIQSHPQIKEYAKRRQKRTGEVLLDRAFHHRAMQRLSRMGSQLRPEKMGRPDIVHNALLQVLETPLNWEGHLHVFVHTQDDNVISINPAVRLPKNYVRFVGLIEQLFAEKRVPRTGQTLLRMEKMGLPQLIEKCKPTKVLGFTRQGKPYLMRRLAEDARRLDTPLVFIGGFPRGQFSVETKQLADELISVDKESLDAWVVAGRFVYDYESAIGLPEARLNSMKAT